MIGALTQPGMLGNVAVSLVILVAVWRWFPDQIENDKQKWTVDGSRIWE